MNSKLFAGAWLLAAFVIATAGFAATPEEEDAAVRAKVKANLGKATVSLSDALQSALAKVAGGQAVEAGFEVEGDRLEFYIEVIAGGKHQDVSIDAKTGKIVAVEDTEKEEADEKKIEESAAKAKITMRQAVEIAQKQVPRGKPYEAIPDMDGDVLVYLVGLLTSDKFVAVEIDANSGKVLGMEDTPAK
jgi:uncharacterized membrane protein YkoI